VPDVADVPDGAGAVVAHEEELAALMPEPEAKKRGPYKKKSNLAG